MQNGGSRMESQIAKGHDLGVVPAELGRIVHYEHMIRKMFTEAELRIVGLLLRCRCFDNFDGLHKKLLSDEHL